jgi:hypothetical protein
MWSFYQQMDVFVKGRVSHKPSGRELCVAIEIGSFFPASWLFRWPVHQRAAPVLLSDTTKNGRATSIGIRAAGGGVSVGFVHLAATGQTGEESIQCA